MRKIDYPTHVTIVAWVNIGLSALIASIGVFGLFFLTGIGIAAGDPKATGILGFVGVAGAAFLLLFSLPGFLAGYGLLKRRRWGRFLGIVVSVIDLFEIPAGTVVGVYGLWVLMAEEATAYFSGASASRAA